MIPVEITIDLFRHGQGEDPAQFTKRLNIPAVPPVGSVLCVDFISAEVKWVRLILDKGEAPEFDIRAEHIYSLPEDLDHVAQHLESDGWNREA